MRNFQTSDLHINGRNEGKMARGSGEVSKWARCQSRRVYNTKMVVIGMLLLVVAFQALLSHMVLVEDLSQDLLTQASRTALGRRIAPNHHHHHHHRAVLEWKAKHDPVWVTRVIQSGTPSRAGGFSVLVTGAAGFIGSFTSMAMRKKGWGVVGLDNFNDYYDPSLKLEREMLMLKNGRIFVVHGDINDEDLIEDLFDLVAFTHVVHLAAQSGVRYANNAPLSYVHSNVAGLVTLLEVCARANPQPTFVWASSSSVYGLNDRLPFSEGDRTNKPASLYAATKKAGEHIVHVYNHVYGLSVTSLRFFTVYGPYGRPDTAVFNFTQSILNHDPISIYLSPGNPNSNSTMVQDFTYIDDIVNGIMAAVETSAKSIGKGKQQGVSPHGSAEFRTFNLGSSRAVAVEDMLSLLEKSLDTLAIRRYQSMEGTGEVPYTAANLSLAEKHLGYHPRISLTTGIQKFALWYLEYKYNNRDGRGPATAFSPQGPQPSAAPHY